MKLFYLKDTHVRGNSGSSHRKVQSTKPCYSSASQARKGGKQETFRAQGEKTGVLLVAVIGPLLNMATPLWISLKQLPSQGNGFFQ